MEIYYELINIFPNVDRAYVKTLCPADCAPGDRDALLAALVERILNADDAVPKIVANDYDDSEAANFRTSSIDDVYENLLEIFPDADPHFLRDFAEKNVDETDELKRFIERNLEQRDYPTREQYKARLKIVEQQRRYTNGFDVKQYLSVIPDPEKYFRNAKRGSENGAEDILSLQETAYRKHKNEIDAYIARAKKAERDEFETLKAQQLLLECECCFDTECVPSKCCNCDNGHIFCNECVINGTNAKLGDGITRINCFVNCGSDFRLSTLQRILPPTTFSILLKKRQAAEVMEAGVEGIVSCPFCHFASIPAEGDKIFKCLNPECAKESCLLCKELSHVPLKCEEVMKPEKARLYVEEKMTAALARTCYRCKKLFVKEFGCNKITCVCGAMMCYLCDQPITDYTHFQPRGSNDPTRCQLYSDTLRLDEAAVRTVAEQAQLEVLQKIPNVGIDIRNQLSAIPRPQLGLGQDVLNVEQLPRRVQRVLNLPPV